MTKINKIFIVFLLVTFVGAAVPLFFPDLSAMGLTGTVVVTIISTATLLGAVWFFLSSLQTFKRGLKTAYYFLAAGIMSYSLILLQFFLVLFAGIEDVFLRNMLFLVPYGLALLLMYCGMRIFARLLGVKSLWCSFLFVFGAATLVALAATQLPHSEELIAIGIDEATLDLISGILTWSTFVGIASVVLILYVRHLINPTYKAAMTWTALAQCMLAFSALHELITKIYFFDSSYVASDFSQWPFVLTGVLFLRAGLYFQETKGKVVQLPDNASYVDIVAATAELVSKPTAVGTELSLLRAIEARTPDPRTISQEDKTALKQIYLYLEDYLVSQEPLSKFTREKLRESLPKEFAAGLGRQVGSDIFHDQGLKSST
jgi:hypothetical protein